MISHQKLRSEMRDRPRSISLSRTIPDMRYLDQARYNLRMLTKLWCFESYFYPSKVINGKHCLLQIHNNESLSSAGTVTFSADTPRADLSAKIEHHTQSSVEAQTTPIPSKQFTFVPPHEKLHSADIYLRASVIRIGGDG